MTSSVGGIAPLDRLRAIARGVAQAVRTAVGAPDYERYLRHMRARHPGAEPLTREAFARERLAARYDRPGSRCC
jgi:uncharacterized short protein YbdD (DUF466 family)